MERMSCGIIKGGNQLEMWLWMLDFKAVYSNIKSPVGPTEVMGENKTPNLSKIKVHAHQLRMPD